MKKKISWLIRDEGGAITAMTVIMMAAFVGILAVVIDLGHLHTVQNELRNAADAAALAGARRLMPMTAPVGGPAEPPWPMETPPPCEDAKQAAIDTAYLNKAAGAAQEKNITLVPGEVVTGVWDFKPVDNRAGTFTASACGSTTNAVKVTARMQGDLSQGSVIMTFAQIFGIATVNPSVEAVAVVGYLATLPKDSKGGFLASDYDFMKKAEENWSAGNTDQLYYLVLGPAGGQTSYQYADNGGWSLPSGTYQSFNPTLNDYIDNTTQVDISVGDTVDLKNGEMSNAVKNLQQEVKAAINQGKTGLDLSILGVYADELGASVGDAWNERNTRVSIRFGKFS